MHLAGYDKKIVEADVTHTYVRSAHCDVNMTNIEHGGEQVGQKPVGSQAGSKSWLLLGSEVVDRKGNFPELEIWGIDVAEEMGLFLLDQFLEDTDVFALRNLHSKHLVLRITDNEAIEREQLCGIDCMDHSLEEFKQESLQLTRRFYQDV